MYVAPSHTSTDRSGPARTPGCLETPVTLNGKTVECRLLAPLWMCLFQSEKSRRHIPTLVQPFQPLTSVGVLTSNGNAFQLLIGGLPNPRSFVYRGKMFIHEHGKLSPIGSPLPLQHQARSGKKRKEPTKYRSIKEFEEYRLPPSSITSKETKFSLQVLLGKRNKDGSRLL